MKRGLKDVGELVKQEPHGIVALITPMKRGLKVYSSLSNVKISSGCTNYPDEKGTERLHRGRGERVY